MSNLGVEPAPDPRDVQFLIDRIIEYNCQVTGFHDGELLAIFSHGDRGEIQAGLSGFTWGGVCKIEWLWVSDALRGQGIGRGLMAQAEEEARRRGCLKIVLDTHSFQAPGFYQKLGFKTVGSLADFPRGHHQFFLEKELA
jgi:GNAT superfamily N-acetyltransferase